jgi:hypothetical protein
VGETPASPPEYATPDRAPASTVDATTLKFPRFTRSIDPTQAMRRATAALAVLALAAAILVLSPQVRMGARVAWQSAEGGLSRAAVRAMHAGSALLGRDAFARGGAPIQEPSRSAAAVSMP